MINYVRHLSIYYDMLIARVLKREYILNFRSISIDNNQQYFNFAQDITKNLLSNVFNETIALKIIPVTLSSSNTQQFFNFDTSSIWYVDSKTFTTDPSRTSGNALYYSDYTHFSIMNDYHIRQAFTFNQLQSLLQILGLTNDNIGKATFDILNLSYNDLDYVSNFEINPTSQYTIQNLDFNFDSISGINQFFYTTAIENVLKQGVVIEMWKQYPTISNIIYDINFDPIEIQQPNNEIVYTPFPVSTPLTMLKNKILFFLLSKFFYTDTLCEWEYDFEFDPAIEQIYPNGKLVVDTYYTYVFSVGNYKNIDSLTLIMNLGNSLIIGPNEINNVNVNISDSVTIEIMNYETIANDITNTLLQSFTITNANLRLYNINTNLTFLKVKYDKDLQLVTTNTTTILTNLHNKLVLLSVSPSSLAQIQNKSNQILLILNQQLMNNVTALVKTNVTVLTTVEQMTALLDSILGENVRNLNILLDDLINIFLMIKRTIIFSFVIDDSVDTRVHTPTKLYNFDQLSLFNNFATVRDVILFLTADLIATIYPISNLTTGTENKVSINTSAIYDNFTLIDTIQRNFQISGFANLLIDIRTGINSKLDALAKITDLPRFIDPNAKPVENYYRYKLPSAPLPTMTINYKTFTSKSNKSNTAKSKPKPISIRKSSKETIVHRSYLRYHTIKAIKDKKYKNPTINATSNSFHKSINKFVNTTALTSLTRKTDKSMKTLTFTPLVNTNANINTNINTNTNRVIDSIINPIQYNSDFMGANMIIVNTNSNLLVTPESLNVLNIFNPDTSSSTVNPNDPYVGSELYIKLYKILKQQIPMHAWVRYLGYRLVEYISIVIDGEEIDAHNSDLMLLLHRLTYSLDQERGFNNMIGHIPEMYTINSESKPAIRLYVQLYFWFSKGYSNSLPMVNMLYSNVFLKIKLRTFDEVFYVEDGGELVRPVKINCKLLGNFVYLGDDERKKLATIKTENLMERFRFVGCTNIKSKNDITSLIDTYPLSDTGIINGTSNNIIYTRLYLEDPCKFFIFQLVPEYPTSDPRDKIYWDLANYRDPDANGVRSIDSIIHDIMKYMKITMNGKKREQWRDVKVYQILQPYNKFVNPLESGEYFYSFALAPGILQPSGTTNLSEVHEFTLSIQLLNS